MAGVHFFSPLGFRHQKPRGQERQDLMVVPAFPVAHFIVGQPGFALGALETFFDAVFGFGRPSELRFGRVGTGIGQVVIGLEKALVAVFVAKDDQDFFGAFLWSFN